MRKLIGSVPAKTRGAYCNIDLFAQLKGQRVGLLTPNPYLDAAACTELVREAARYLRSDYTHGGYGENRSVLWRDSYLKKRKAFTHLGYDINLDAHTPLYLPFEGTVCAVGDDTQNFGLHGWGRWCIVSSWDIRDHLFIFAHLGELPRVGREYGCGERFATIGAPETNGGWYPHVHVQVVDDTQHPFFAQENADRGDLEKFMNVLDGYATEDEFRRDAGRVYHDPMNWIW
jgi:hypothetical protein